MKSVKKRILICIVLVIALSNLVALVANAESEYFSTLSQDEIEKIFRLETDDIAHAWDWIMDTQTFVVIERNNGEITYWWNTPNIQMSAFNSLYSVVMMSGYGSGHGILATEDEWIVTLPERDEAHTAMQKYGFNIPNPTYMGERPLISISILGVLLPDSVGGFFSRMFDLVFDGDIVSTPTNDDLNSLVYMAPRDYVTGANTFQAWVDKNWYDIMHDGPGDDPYIKPGQILLSSANDKGMYADVCWVRDTIIDQHDLAEETDAAIICQKLSEICGPYYSDVAKNIIIASGIDSGHMTERIMPYDLSRMNAGDLDRFKGVSDPRSDMQENVLSTGYLNVLSNLFKSKVIQLSGKLAEMTVALNSLCNFAYLESIGLDPTFLWTNNIIQFLVLIMGVVFLYYVMKSVIKVVTGKGGTGFIVLKLVATFILVSIVVAISIEPQGTYETIKNVSSSVWSISNVTLTNNEKLTSLYGSRATAVEKENCSLWLPYFNTWTSYQTSHSLLDNEQTLDKTSLEPEEKNLVMPTIDSKEQTLWSTVLADDFTSNENYSGSIYRVVDHFMAPRISNLSLHDGNASFDVRTNENYNKDIQTTINLSSIPFQLLIFILVIIKVVIFFEFILNIIMLFINICLTVGDNKNFVRMLQKLGASMLDVMIVGIFITLVIYTSLVADGIAGIVLAIAYYFFFWCIVKAIFNSNSVFKPKFMELTQKGMQRLGRMFQEG